MTTSYAKVYVLSSLWLLPVFLFQHAWLLYVCGVIQHAMIPISWMECLQKKTESHVVSFHVQTHLYYTFV